MADGMSVCGNPSYSTVVYQRQNPYIRVQLPEWSLLPEL